MFSQQRLDQESSTYTTLLSNEQAEVASAPNRQFAQETTQSTTSESVAVLKEDWAPATRSAAGIPEISVAWVWKHMDAARLIDVRQPAEVQSLGLAPGAELVPLNTVASVARSWDRSQPLIIICRSGIRSGMAALELEAMGFQKVLSMAGGMMRWAECRYPLAT